MTRPTNVRGDERGAVAPIFALLILVFLIFAAFAVDLGAAWAERRQDQTAADAAAMGAALQYLQENDSPTPQDTIDLVIDYASRNLPDAPTPAEWQACIDAEKPDAYYIPLTDDGGSTYDCISLRQESDAPVRLRVRIPDRSVPTAFASIIGIDTIEVSAAAIAEITSSDLAQVLPFSVPSDPATEECFGVPPNGHNDGDVAPCDDGSDSGTYGLLDSPWFGSGSAPHHTSAPCDDSSSTFDQRSRLNLALGLDHIIKVWPYDPLPPVDTDVKNEQTYQGQDTCTASDNDVPGAMRLQEGTYDNNAAALSDGLIGVAIDGAGGSVDGRLRQIGGLNTGASTQLSFAGAGLDNVGLWEYVTGSGLCDFGPTGPGNVGRALTEQIIDCVESGDPLFSMELTESPRFALVPVLGYTTGAVSGGSAYPVHRLTPVYLQSAWFGCDGSNGASCLFHPEDFVNEAMDPDATEEWDDTVPMWYTPIFNPGEGDTVPCFSKKGYEPEDYEKKPGDFNCVSPGPIVLKGQSGIVLDWSMFPEGAENAIGSYAPYLVELYR